MNISFPTLNPLNNYDNELHKSALKDELSKKLDTVFVRYNEQRIQHQNVEPEPSLADYKMNFIGSGILVALLSSVYIYEKDIESFFQITPKLPHQVFAIAGIIIGVVGSILNFFSQIKGQQIHEKRLNAHKYTKKVEFLKNEFIQKVLLIYSNLKGQGRSVSNISMNDLLALFLDIANRLVENPTMEISESLTASESAIIHLLSLNSLPEDSAINSNHWTDIDVILN